MKKNKYLTMLFLVLVLVVLITGCANKSTNNQLTAEHIGASGGTFEDNFTITAATTLPTTVPTTTTSTIPPTTTTQKINVDKIVRECKKVIDTGGFFPEVEYGYYIDCLIDKSKELNESEICDKAFSEAVGSNYPGYYGFMVRVQRECGLYFEKQYMGE